jgi:hypothetical protein
MLISSFLFQRKFRISAEGEMSRPKNVQAGAPQGSILPLTLYSLCVNDTPQTHGVYLGLFADDTCILAADQKKVMFSESCSQVSVLFRCGVSAGTQKSMRISLRPSTFLIDLGPLRLILLIGRNILFVSYVKYLGLIFDKRMKWRLHIEMIKAKALKTFITIYSILKSERLSINIKLTLHKSLISSVMTCLSRLGISSRNLPGKIAAPAEQGSAHH